MKAKAMARRRGRQPPNDYILYIPVTGGGREGGREFVSMYLESEKREGAGGKGVSPPLPGKGSHDLVQQLV